MAQFLLQRLWQSLVVLLVVLTVVFFLARAQGSPAAMMLPLGSSPEDIEAVNEDLGLNEPLYYQYGLYLGRLLKGDLGRSYIRGRTVSSMFAERFPATLQLAGAAMGIVLVLGVVLGVVASVTRHNGGDLIIRWFVALAQATPTFWLAFVLIWLIGVKAGWLPFVGRQEATSFILPAIAIAAYPMAGVARLTRSGMLEALGQEYIFFARAKGLREHMVVLKHGLRNALLPVVTFSGIVLVSHFLIGALIVEIVMSWPGVGFMAWRGMIESDYPVLQGLVVIFAAMFIFANLLVDMSYALLDPRIRRLAARTG